LFLGGTALADAGRYHLELRGTSAGGVEDTGDEGAAAGATGTQVFVLERQGATWFPTFASDTDNETITLLRGLTGTVAVTAQY
jgi:hypothetical protein